MEHTDQSEDLEEVQVGVEDVLYRLQLLMGEGAHVVADRVHALTAVEEDEALQQGLAAGDVFQLQVWDPEGKLLRSPSQSLWSIQPVTDGIMLLVSWILLWVASNRRFTLYFGVHDFTTKSPPYRTIGTIGEHDFTTLKCVKEEPSPSAIFWLYCRLRDYFQMHV